MRTPRRCSAAAWSTTCSISDARRLSTTTDASVGSPAVDERQTVPGADHRRGVVRADDDRRSLGIVPASSVRSSVALVAVADDDDAVTCLGALPAALGDHGREHVPGRDHRGGAEDHEPREELAAGDEGHDRHRGSRRARRPPAATSSLLRLGGSDGSPTA